MKKSDLKNEMVIQTRNGDISVLYDGVLHTEDGFEVLEEYQEDLIFPNWYDVDVSELDIMKVGVSSQVSLFRKVSQKDSITWIWEREECVSNESKKEFSKSNYEFLSTVLDMYRCRIGMSLEKFSAKDLEQYNQVRKIINKSLKNKERG